MLAVAVSVHPFQMLAVPVDCKYVVDRHGYFLPAFYELNDPYQEKKKRGCYMVLAELEKAFKELMLKKPFRQSLFPFYIG